MNKLKNRNGINISKWLLRFAKYKFIISYYVIQLRLVLIAESGHFSYNYGRTK